MLAHIRTHTHIIYTIHRLAKTFRLIVRDVLYRTFATNYLKFRTKIHQSKPTRQRVRLRNLSHSQFENDRHSTSSFYNFNGYKGSSASLSCFRCSYFPIDILHIHKYIYILIHMSFWKYFNGRVNRSADLNVNAFEFSHACAYYIMCTSCARFSGHISMQICTGSKLWLKCANEFAGSNIHTHIQCIEI